MKHKSDFLLERKNIINVLWYISTLIYTAVLAMVHIIRIFDRNFWADEAFTVNTVNAGFGEMIQITAADVHPPLYYILVKIMCEIFGYNGTVYHLASLVPYILILILGLTVIWKWFGKETSIIFVSFSSLLTTSIQMTVEVRMYSWAALFVLCSFLSLYKILKSNKNIYWVLFTLFSLAAAYTHYYALITVAFFYVTLIIDVFFKRRNNWKRIIITCCTTIIAYLPWLFVFIESVKRTTNDFWQTEIERIYICIEYIFSSKYSIMFFMIWMVLVFIWFILETGIILIKKDEGRYKIEVLNKKNIVITDNSILVMASVFSLFGTILVGRVVSILLRPMFIARYLFPVAITVWLVFGICISKFKFKMIYTLIITFILLSCGIPKYLETYSYEQDNNARLEQTLALVEPEIEQDDIIVSDNVYMWWAVSKAYFPENECKDIGEVIDNLDLETDYWFFVSNQFDDTQVQNMSNLGFEVVLLKQDGVIGTYPFVVYKISSIN